MLAADMEAAYRCRVNPHHSILAPSVDPGPIMRNGPHANLEHAKLAIAKLAYAKLAYAKLV